MENRASSLPTDTVKSQWFSHYYYYTYGHLIRVYTHTHTQHTGTHLLEKAWSHWVHLYFLSPVCSFTCRSRLRLCLNSLRQNWHLNGIDSPWVYEKNKKQNNKIIERNTVTITLRAILNVMLILLLSVFAACVYRYCRANHDDLHCCSGFRLSLLYTIFASFEIINYRRRGW